MGTPEAHDAQDERYDPAAIMRDAERLEREAQDIAIRLSVAAIVEERRDRNGAGDDHRYDLITDANLLLVKAAGRIGGIDPTTDGMSIDDRFARMVDPMPAHDPRMRRPQDDV